MKMTKYKMQLPNGVSGIGSFESTLSLQMKEGIKTYQALLRHVAYILQQALKDEWL